MDLYFINQNKSVYENIVEGAHDVIDILREYENLTPNSEKRRILEEQILHRDGWNLENRIETAMHSLNVPDKQRAIDTLSGGEKRRVALCKAIISRPDFLILDEPTNHLDTQSIEWIEEYLEKKGAIVKTTCFYIMPVSEIQPDFYLKEIKEAVKFPWE